MRLRIMERSSVDLMDVLAFVRVVETGAFARAAERMGMSKSILSRRVARLEEQLGAKLLTRTAQGAHPTDIGKASHARATAVPSRRPRLSSPIPGRGRLYARRLRLPACGPAGHGTAHSTKPGRPPRTV